MPEKWKIKVLGGAGRSFTGGLTSIDVGGRLTQQGGGGAVT